jgi:DNA-binding NarL/FixJ family response regulator
VLLADDHRLFREGVASLLERAGDVELAGEAATGEEALRRAEELSADVVLMDLKMPGMGGIEATRAIVGQSPRTGVIVVTMFEDDESVFAALKAGARGYVLKDAGRGELLRAIRAVARGEALLGAPIARRVLEQFSEPPPTVTPPHFEELTARELEVLGLIARGLKNREIAEKLVISERTVGNHVSNIFAKVPIASRPSSAPGRPGLAVRARSVGVPRHARGG